MSVIQDTRDNISKSKSLKKRANVPYSKKGKVGKKVNKVASPQPSAAVDTTAAADATTAAARNEYEQMTFETQRIDWDYFPGNGFCLLDSVYSVFSTDRLTLHADALDSLIQISGKIDKASREVLSALGACNSAMVLSGKVKPYAMQVLDANNIVTFIHNLSFIYHEIKEGRQAKVVCNYYLGNGLYFKMLGRGTSELIPNYDDVILGSLLRATKQSTTNLHNILCLRVVDFMCIYKRLASITSVIPHFYAASQSFIPCAFTHPMLHADTCEVCQPRVCPINCYGKFVSG